MISSTLSRRTPKSEPGTHLTAGFGGMPLDFEAKLARFAAGKSPEEERTEVKALLQQRPDVIPLLVAALRSLTPGKR